MVEYKPGDVCHVEIVTNDPNGARKFAEELYGWNITEMPPEMNYTLFETPGGYGGGIREPGENEVPGTLAYVLVEDLDAEVKRVEAAGAQVVWPKTAVPGMGWMAVFIGPGGFAQGLWQADESASE